MAQLNWYLGRNTAYFHLQYPLPKLTCQPVKQKFDCKDLTPFDGKLPYPQVVDDTGGTPNQKAERVANQMAFYFFTNPDRKEGPKAYKNAVRFFTDQADHTGHQCIGKSDEGLTPSHGPIWWRAVASLRITSWGIANGLVPWFKNGDLEQAVLGWIQWHQDLSALGEILGGPQKWKVLLPGSRWSGKATLFPSPCPKVKEPDAPFGGPYTKEPMTDQVSSVIYQLIKTGSVEKVPWKLGGGFWNLDPCSLDRVGAPLVKSALEHGLDCCSSSAGAPKLHSQLEVDRHHNGHVARFPCGMPGALKPALWAWADYDTGCMSLSLDGDPPPPDFSGKGQKTVVDSFLPCSGKDDGAQDDGTEEDEAEED